LPKTTKFSILQQVESKSNLRFHKKLDLGDYMKIFIDKSAMKYLEKQGVNEITVSVIGCGG
jgi:hypothetical protein